MLHIGVVGLGTMGWQHAEHLVTSVPGARLIAVADPLVERAVHFAAACHRDYGMAVRVEQEPEALFHAADIAAVVIAGPAGVHTAQVVQAAAQGKQIFCEKPLAMTVADARTAQRAADDAGVALQVGFMRRYDPSYIAAKQAIRDGKIGRPFLFKGVSRDPRPPSRSALQSPLQAGLFLDSAIHDFDVARWLLGDEIIAVSAFGGALVSGDARELGLMDTALVNLRYRSGALGNIECCWQATYGYDVRAEVVGERGAVSSGDPRQTACTMLVAGSGTHDIYPGFLDRFALAYRTELCDFVKRVQEKRPPAVTGEDGVRAVAIAEAATQSWTSGGTVTAVVEV